MKIDRKTLAPLNCASKENYHNLNSLHFDESGVTVGTNGHVLAYVEPSESITIKPFTLDASSLVNLQREQKKSKAIPAELNVDTTDEGNFVQITTSTGCIELTKTDGEYPNWKQVLPPEPCDTDYEIEIDALVLESILATVRQFTGTNKSQKAYISFRFTANDLKPFAAEVTSDGQILKFAAMPLKKK